MTMFTTYSGISPDQYDNEIVQIFELIYEGDKKKIDEILINLLRRVLKKYPNKPTTEEVRSSPEIEGDRSLLRLLGLYFTEALYDWSYENNLRSNKDYYDYEETNRALNESVTNPTKADKIIFGIMHYITNNHMTNYTYEELHQMLDSYPN